MTLFNDSFENTIKWEGGYSNDEYDTGGETYMGISRVHHPDWSGWKIIDKNRSEGIGLDSHDILLSVKDFYRINYWNKIKGDKLLDQKIADKVFDIAVNMGIGTSIKFLQTGLNILNRGQRNYQNIVVDGKIGNKTLEALKYYLRNDKNIHLLKIINILQGNKYIRIVQNNGTQQKFIRGWLKRVNI